MSIYKPPVERMISVFAPYECLICGVEGTPVCADCQPSLSRAVRGVCFMCNGLSQDFKTCTVCSRKTKLKRVWVACRYEAYVKELIRKFKYERSRESYKSLAKLIEQSVIAGSYDFVLSVPVVSGRFRIRGYNQARLLAEHIAKTWKIPLYSGLHRLGQKRQVGQSRKLRSEQLKGSFYIANSQKLKDKQVLLIDDVITTGATLDNCAEVVSRAGAKSVEAAVIAKG